MPSGISLGGAYFELTGSSAGLITALKQAEDASKASVARISQSTGIAEADVRRYGQTVVTESKRAADARAQATLRIIKADNDAAASAAKVAASQKNAATEVLGYVKAGGAFVAAAAGITTGAAAIQAGMAKVGEETQKAAQAQFALNELYGAAAPLVTQQAEALAKLTGRSRTDAKEAAADVATLARNYALTGEQIQKVLKISADLAAVRGISLAAAAERTQSALRGEAEAIEYLGVALQSNALKALATMTAEERAHFETLNDVTKAQIILNALNDQTASLQGAAAKRTKDAAGAADNLKTSIDNLSESIGKKFTPETMTATNAFADLIEKTEELVNSKLVQTTIDVARNTAFMTEEILKARDAYEAFLGIQRAVARVGAEGRIQVGPDPGMPGAGPGPTKEQAQAIADGKALAKQAAARDRDALAAYVARQSKAIGEVADAREKAARAAAKLADDAIDKEKIRLEVAKAAALKSLDERHRAAIKALEVEERAAEDASKAAIERAEQEKKSVLDAAEMAKTQALGALKAKKEALDQEREIEDRGRDDTRRSQDQLLADRRRAQDDEAEAVKRGVTERREVEDRALAERRQHEDQARADRRKEEDADLAADRSREDRRLDARVKRLAQQRTAEDQARSDSRKAEDQALSDRREQQDRELEAGHKAELDRIEQEHAARVKVIDDQLEAIKALKEARLKALDDEADTLRTAAEQASRELDARYEAESRARDAAYEAETRQRDALHEQAQRGFQAEADAARAAADRESRARDTAHDARLRQIDQEADAARKSHDDALASIDREKDAEEDRHRAALSAIDQESRARLSAIDEQLGVLDAADRADQQAAKQQQLEGNVTNARFGVKRAESTGDQSEIIKAEQELAAAEQALRQVGVQNTRDTQRDILRAQQDTIKAEADSKKAAEDEANRQRQREIQAERDAADTILKIALDALAGRKTAEDGAYAVARQKAADALALILADIDRRKTAESDAYAVAKQAAQDAYEATKRAAHDAYEATKLAAADALAKQLDVIAQRKQAISDETDKLLADLQKRRDAEQTAYQADVDRINARYQMAKQGLDGQRTAEDRALADRRTADDRDLTEHRLRQDTKLSEDKTRIGDRRTAEDFAISTRRTNEDRDLGERRLRDDNARKDERGAEDLRFKEAGERLTAQRLAEDRALSDKRLADDRSRKDYRDAEDKSLRDQQTAIENQFQGEKDATEAHYNGPQGIITKIRAAMQLAKDAYKDRREYSEDQFRQERDALNAVYHNEAKTGLLDLQDAAAKNNALRLSDQLAAITVWKDLAGKFIDENKGKWTGLAEAIDAVGKAIKGLPTTAPVPTPTTGIPRGGTTTPEPAPGGSPPGGSVPGPGAPGAGGGVPGPWGVTFPFDAPYNGPYAGGAAWPGGPSRHRGVDLKLPGPDNGRGTTYGAFQGGSVVSVGWDDAGGNGIIIKTDSGLYNYYGHNDKILASSGKHVDKGEPIGILGRTGLDGGMQTHLHYEVRRGINGDPVGSTINPVPYMHASGYLFAEPTLTYGMRSGERGMIGETGRPERLLGVDETAAYAAVSRGGHRFAGEAMPERMVGAGASSAGRRDRIDVDIRLDGQTQQRIWIDGYHLLARRGGLPVALTG